MWGIFINQLYSFMAQMNWLDDGNMIQLIHVEHNKVRDIELLEGMTSKSRQDR